MTHAMLKQSVCIIQYTLIVLLSICFLDEIPDNVDYEHPEKAGFLGGRNFYLNTSDGATLGVW